MAISNTLEYLNYGPRPAFAARPEAYHNICAKLAEGVDGVERAYGAHALQRLTIYQAERPTGKVLLAFHGGRFVHGYREWLAGMAGPLRSAGVTLVSASYRLLQDGVYPTSEDDARDALRWVVANADEIGGDADAIFVGGHSSGAYLATMLATDAEFCGGTGRSIIAGCLPISGLFDMTLGTPTQKVLFPDGASEDVCKAASPILRDLQRSAPFLVCWGEDDLPSVIEQSAAMVDALKSAGVVAEELVLAGADHFDAALEPCNGDSRWVDRAQTFMTNCRT